MNKLAILISAALLLAGPSQALADSGADTKSPLDYWLDARMRGEWVSQDNLLSDASAITLRTRLGFDYAFDSAFSVLAEAENIFALQDDYNSTTNRRIDHSVVADPEDTEINRLFIQYKGIEDTVATIGRQKLIFDNARYVGNVGWRQNEQTFDAVSIRNTSFSDTTINVAYIDTVRRIFGPDSSIGTTDMQSPVINVAYNGFADHSLVAYGYFLSFDDAPLNSNKTLGVRLTGKRAFAPVKLGYLVEYADQSDYSDGAGVIDADYLHARLSVSKGDHSVSVGVEQLSGDGVYGFQTPLATGHAFNGWSDMFLVTPANGLVDKYIGASTKVAGFAVRGVWHQFDADIGSADYGSEINVLVTRKLADRFVAGLKFADFQSQDLGVDTTKTWLFVQFKY